MELIKKSNGSFCFTLEEDRMRHLANILNRYARDHLSEGIALNPFEEDVIAIILNPKCRKDEAVMTFEGEVQALAEEAKQQTLDLIGAMSSSLRERYPQIYHTHGNQAVEEIVDKLQTLSSWDLQLRGTELQERYDANERD